MEPRRVAQPFYRRPVSSRPCRRVARKIGRGGKTHAGPRVWATSVLLALLLVIVVAHVGEEEQFAALLRRAQPAWLLVALALQAGTYVCAAGVWQRALARQGVHRSLRDLVPLGVAKLFMDQALPSAGLSGTVLVARALRRRGVPHRTGVAAVLAGLIAFHVAYGIAVAAGLMVLWSSRHLNHFVLSLATAFGAVVVAIPAAIYWMSRHPWEHPPRWLERLSPLKSLLDALGDRPSPVLRDRLFLAEGTALQLIVITLDAGTLSAVLAAIGSPTAFTAVFASFAVASVVATLSLLPSGVGSFDAALIAMLRVFGVPVEGGLGAAVLLRGFTLLLPALPGVWLARAEVR